MTLIISCVFRNPPSILPRKNISKCIDMNPTNSGYFCFLLLQRTTASSMKYDVQGWISVKVIDTEKTLRVSVVGICTKHTADSREYRVKKKNQPRTLFVTVGTSCPMASPSYSFRGQPKPYLFLFLQIATYLFLFFFCFFCFVLLIALSRKSSISL